MAEVDRRGFLRGLRRRAEPEPEVPAAERPLSPEDIRLNELAELTRRLLDDLDATEEEQLAEGKCFTPAFDLIHMRVTTGHIVFVIETGFNVFMKTGDVRDFQTKPPAEFRNLGPVVEAVLYHHHPADADHITRSNAFRFLESSPLMAAIREACDLPEPEPEAEPELEPEAAEDATAE